MGLDAVELVMAIEEEFGIDMSEAESAECQTPRDLIDFLWAKHGHNELFVKPPLHPGLLQRWGWAKPKTHQLKGNIETREQLASYVRAIISEQTGIGKFSDDDRFIDQMGID